MDEEWLDILREEAEKQGLSANALINKIIKDYCQAYRWIERFGTISISRPTISGIISCCPEDELQEIAKISGSDGAKNALRSMGISPTPDSVMTFIETNLGKYGNWFDFNQYTRNRKDVIHLRHELGKNWSIFIATHVSTVIESILHKTVATEIFDNSATLRITQ
ncbi:MAG: hypothetical protein PVH73_03120 [Candidatus Bathyarchaeota archaeon]